MRVRYNGSYPGALEGHSLWSPGEERDVSDEVADQLTRGNGAFWEQVPDVPAEDEPQPESVAVTTPDEAEEASEPAHKRRRGATQES